MKITQYIRCFIFYAKLMNVHRLKTPPKLFPHTKINKLLSQNGLPSVKSAVMHKGTCC